MQADGMRNAALIVLGSDDPHLAGELARDLFEHREARRLDAVVIGQQDAIQHAIAASVATGSRGTAVIRLFLADP